MSTVKRPVRHTDRYTLNIPSEIADDLNISHQSTLAWIDHYPHDDDLYLSHPANAPDTGSQTRAVRRHQGEFVIPIPPSSLRLRELDPGATLQFDDGDGELIRIHP